LAAERPDPNDRLTGEGMIGVAQHFLGDLPSARRHLEHVLVGYVTPDQTSHIVRFQTDQRVLMSVFFARVLWLQGFPDQATRAAHSTVEDAHAANHTISLCQALAHAACPLALLTGDLAAAEHYSTMLLDHSTRFALAFWRAWGRSFQGVLVIQRGDVITGLRLLRAGFDEIGKAGFAIFRLIAILMAEALVRAGQNADGLAAVEEAIARAKRTEERWAMAELVRVRGRGSAVAGRIRSRGGGRGSLPASARLGAPPGRVVLGTSRYHQPRSASLQSGPTRRCAGAAPTSLRPVYRGVRYGRPQSRKGASRRELTQRTRASLTRNARDWACRPAAGVCWASNLRQEHPLENYIGRRALGLVALFGGSASQFQRWWPINGACQPSDRIPGARG
jgi:hypothetical protein